MVETDFHNFQQAVCAVVAECRGERLESVTPERFICAGRRSLGVDGADADELLALLQQRFGASFEHFPFDRYFGPELGWEPFSWIWAWLTGRLKPLDTITVGQLVSLTRPLFFIPANNKKDP